MASAMAEKAKYPASIMPSWAAAPFHEFLDHHEQAMRLLHLTMRGIAMVRGAPRALEVLAEVDNKTEEEETQRRLEDARGAAELAQSEVEKGFPILHEQAAISLWGSLEALVKALVVAWLVNKPECFKAKELERVKIQLGEYMGLTQLEQCEYVVTLLDQQEGGGQRFGTTRFETLLSPIGVSGSVDADVTRAIFELQQVRHVLVHRRGLADRKLLEACPWLKVQLGDRVVIDHATYNRLSKAAHDYVLEIIQRAREQFGVGRFDTDTWEKEQRSTSTVQPSETSG